METFFWGRGGGQKDMHKSLDCPIAIMARFEHSRDTTIVFFCMYIGGFLFYG